MFGMDRKLLMPAAVCPRPKPFSSASAVSSVSTPSRFRSPNPVTPEQPPPLQRVWPRHIKPQPPRAQTKPS